MKSNYKKTFWGSLAVFFIGTSCCWLSSLAIWIGGATVIGVVSNFIEDIQIFLVIIGFILTIISLFLFFKQRD